MKTPAQEQAGESHLRLSTYSDGNRESHFFPSLRAMTGCDNEL